MMVYMSEEALSCLEKEALDRSIQASELSGFRAFGACCRYMALGGKPGSPQLEELLGRLLKMTASFGSGYVPASI